MAKMGRALIDYLSQSLNEIRDGISKELPDLDCEHLILEGKMNMLAIFVSDFMTHVLKEFDLAPAEQQVLGILRGRAADSPGMLARATHQSAPGMTRTLDRLESRGLVQRRADAKDRRRVTIQLTRKGRNLADRKLRVEITAWQDLFDGASTTEIDHIHRALDQLLIRFSEERSRNPR